MNARFRCTSAVPLLAAVLLLLSGTAQAQISDTFQVTANVVDVCTFETPNDLDFGTYDPTAVGALTGTTTVVAACTTGTTAQIALDGGGGADVANRRMIGQTNSDPLTYQLFQDSGGAQVWGQTPATDTVVFNGTGVLSPQNITVFGEVAAGQDVSVDSYVDTITATLTINP